MTTSPIAIEFESLRLTLKPGSPFYDECSELVSRVRKSLDRPKGFVSRVARLYEELDDPSRDILVWIAQRAGMVGQQHQWRLERALGLDPYALRARLGGIGKIAKRLGIRNPVRSIGRDRRRRYFVMTVSATATVLYMRAVQ